VTTVFYLARKKQGSEGAKRVVRDLLKVYSIAPVNEAILHEAVRSAMSDFEDGVTAAAAQAAGCALIVTRDPRGFKGATLPCMSPEEALPLLGQ
jgi:predicted nucleic acid-binding protein